MSCRCNDTGLEDGFLVGSAILAVAAVGCFGIIWATKFVLGMAGPGVTAVAVLGFVLAVGQMSHRKAQREFLERINHG